MTEFQLSEREELLLNAALNPSVDIARQSWENWASQGAIENVPRHELRLLPAVYAHLSRMAPAFRLPSKLRGKAKAIFTRSNLLASATLPMIDELSRHCPVMLTKGLAMCIRFGTWSSRPMADVDIHVPAESLKTVCGILANSGWTPRYGMTLPSLIHRTSLRRDSWNFTKGAADIDLHWRLPAGPAENWLTEEMWQSGERFAFRGHSLLLQSPEFALVSSLRHGFRSERSRRRIADHCGRCAVAACLHERSPTHPLREVRPARSIHGADVDLGAGWSSGDFA